MNANRFLFLLGFLLLPLLFSIIKCDAESAKTKNQQSIKTLEGYKTTLTTIKATVDTAVGKINEASNKVDGAHGKAEAAVNAITPVKTDVTTKSEAVKAAANEAKAAKTNRETAKTKLATLTTKLGELKTAAAAADAQKQNLTAAETEGSEGYAEAKKQLELIVEEQKKTVEPMEESNKLQFDNEDNIDTHAERKKQLEGLKGELETLVKAINTAVIENTKKLNDIGNKNIETYKKILQASKDMFDIRGLVSDAETAANEATQAVNEASGSGSGSADGHLFVKNNSFNHEGLLADDKKCTAEDKTKAACKANSNCYKVDGKAICLCYPGFAPKDAQTSECVKNASMTCQSGSHNCHANATCKLDNQLGIGCKCKPEYKGDGILCSNSMKSMLSIIFVLAVASVQLLF